MMVGLGRNLDRCEGCDGSLQGWEEGLCQVIRDTTKLEDRGRYQDMRWRLVLLLVVEL